MLDPELTHLGLLDCVEKTSLVLFEAAPDLADRSVVDWPKPEDHIGFVDAAIKAFEIDYGAKYPKAVAKIVDDADVLLEFYKYPAEHWIHLRTTNPIVIWGSFGGVLDVRHAGSGSLVLRAGCGYLQLSRRHSLRRADARCSGHLTGLVA